MGNTSSRPTRLSLRFQILLSLALGLSLVSGIVWWWGLGQWDPLDQPDRYRQLRFWRILHGSLNPLIIVLVGWLWGRHVSAGWRMKANRWSGVPLFGVLLILIGSGVVLYYAGDEELREAAVQIHVVAGFLLPFIFLLHWFLGRRWGRVRK